MKKLKIALASFLFIQFTLSVLAEESKYQPEIVLNSGIKNIPLIEYYTSEGCKECPEANDFVGELAKDDAKFWKENSIITFHIDYWNHLGHVDPFGDAIYSTRQKNLNELNGQPINYTPQFFVDGVLWQAMAKRKKPQKFEEIGELIVRQEQTNSYIVSFKPYGEEASTGYQFYGALLANKITRRIRSGANKGNKITHYMTAVHFQKDHGIKQLADGKPTGLFVSDFNFERKFSQYSPKKYYVVFWVSVAGTIIPIQSVGGPYKEYFLPVQK